MLIEGYTKGVMLHAPDDLPDHERQHPAPNRKKHIFTMEVVERYGVRSVIETHAGFGMLSVEYRRVGVELRGCVEQDSKRYQAPRLNVGERAYLGDSTYCPFETFDADMVDIDPYNTPCPALLGNRRKFRKDQLVLMTYGSKSWRFKYKNFSFLQKLNAEMNGCLIPNLHNLRRTTGEGFCRYVVREWAESFLNLQFLEAMQRPGGTIERVLFRVA